MMFMMLLFTVLIEFHCSSGKAVYKKSEYMPLLDNKGAVLTARIDVSDFNEKMEKFISDQVPAEITGNIEQYINSDRFKSLVRNESKNDIKDFATQLINDLFNNFILSDKFKRNFTTYAEGKLKDTLKSNKTIEDSKTATDTLKSNKTIEDSKTATEGMLPPIDCVEVKERGFTSSGVYTIKPTKSTLKVYCDQATKSGGWIVFQRRIDGSQNFYRGWEDYKNGFGDLNGEFWLGNENIHLLTKNGHNELRVELVTFGGSKAFAEYKTFSISDESSNYELTVSGYSGTAGDSLNEHNGRPFTTKDRDNDKHSTYNCAVLGVGAWWYTSCSYSNLNGEYLKDIYNNNYKGIHWRSWKGLTTSMKMTTMMMRRK